VFDAAAAEQLPMAPHVVVPVLEQVRSDSDCASLDALGYASTVAAERSIPGAPQVALESAPKSDLESERFLCHWVPTLLTEKAPHLQPLAVVRRREVASKSVTAAQVLGRLALTVEPKSDSEQLVYGNQEV
jgi:hypothetical protein